MAKFVGALLASAVLILATAVWARGSAFPVTIAVLLAWAIVGEVELDHRGLRAVARKQALEERVEGPLPATALDYLARLDAELELPAPMRAEIRAELADHINDSIAAIQADGLDLGFATGEALVRLGQPDELARRLRKAHQTPRRLLAGAAGGVWSAGVGAVQGTIVAATVALIAAFTIGFGLRPVVDFVATHAIPIEFDPNELAVGTAMGAALAWIPAFVAGRRAVKACASISARPARQVGRFWALAGILALGWLVVFVLTVQQSWMVVGFELAIPVAFAAGALFKVDAHFPAVAGSWLAVVGGLLLIGPIVLGSVVGGFSVTSGSSGFSTSYTDDSIGWNHVAPHSPDQSINLGYSGSVVGGAPTINVQDPASLSSFHDLRIEAWRANAYPGAPSGPAGGDLGLLDTSYSAPFATAPAVVGAGGTIEDPISLIHSRTPKWWIFLTGVGSDGQRYWLGSRPFLIDRTFSGTIWDWVTASS